MEIDGDRGTGRTTAQIRSAPHGAIFVCCHSAAKDYTRRLAKDLGRDDLTIVEPSWLDHGWMGKVISGLVVDHACQLNENLRCGLLQAQTRIRP